MSKRRPSAHLATGGRPARRSPLRRHGRLLGAALFAATSLACASSGRAPAARPGAPGHGQVGIASWYGPKFQGRATASGEIFDMDRLTAAHPRLPFGTIVEVENLDNGRRVEVRINDRGPFVRGRIIDLSRAAASELGMLGTGTARVALTVLPAGTLPPEPVVYTVQAGAFVEPDRAEALYRELRHRYDGVALESDGVWHRVRIGRFSERRRAEQIARRLAAAGISALILALP